MKKKEQMKVKRAMNIIKKLDGDQEWTRGAGEVGGDGVTPIEEVASGKLGEVEMWEEGKEKA